MNFSGTKGGKSRPDSSKKPSEIKRSYSQPIHAIIFQCGKRYLDKPENREKSPQYPGSRLQPGQVNIERKKKLPVYVETHNPSTDGSGLVSIEIGTGITSDALSSIDWSAGPYFIKTETAPSGETNYTITGKSQLLMVPYAFHAMNAGTADYNRLSNLPELFDGYYSSLTEKPVIPADISELTDNTGFFFDGDYFSLTNIPDINDSIIFQRFDGDYNSLGSKPQIIGDFEVDANFLIIINLSDPVNPQDAVTKKYVHTIMDELSTRIKALEE